MVGGWERGQVRLEGIYVLSDEISEWAAKVEGLEDGIGIAGERQRKWREGERDGPSVSKL